MRMCVCRILHCSNNRAVAVQLKFVVTYFYFLGKNNAFMSGTITIRRQVRDSFSQCSIVRSCVFTEYAID